MRVHTWGCRECSREKTAKNRRRVSAICCCTISLPMRRQMRAIRLRILRQTAVRVCTPLGNLSTAEWEQPGRGWMTDLLWHVFWLHSISAQKWKQHCTLLKYVTNKKQNKLYCNIFLQFSYLRCMSMCVAVCVLFTPYAGWWASPVEAGAHPDWSSWACPLEWYQRERQWSSV